MTNPTPTPIADIHAAGPNLPDELLNLPVVFGLVAQGHLPTVEDMFNAGHSWDDIGLKIGWHGPTVATHYAWCLLGRVTGQSMQVAALQSEIAQLRADLENATANAAKAQDTINGQARELEGLRRGRGTVPEWMLRLAADLLDEYGDRLSNDGCNDYDLPDYVPVEALAKFISEESKWPRAEAMGMTGDNQFVVSGLAYGLRAALSPAKQGGGKDE